MCSKLQGYPNEWGRARIHKGFYFQVPPLTYFYLYPYHLSCFGISVRLFNFAFYKKNAALSFYFHYHLIFFTFPMMEILSKITPKKTTNRTWGFLFYLISQFHFYLLLLIALYFLVLYFRSFAYFAFAFWQ